MEKLQIFLDGELEQEVVLQKAKLTLGRGGRQCDICLDDKAVSRQHLNLIRGDSGYYAKDLGSTNGTILNGERIRSQLLKNGDVLRVGKHELKFLQEPDQESAEVGTEKAAKKGGFAASSQRMYGDAGSRKATVKGGDHLEPGQTGVR